ncbi:MAG: response regulator [Methanomassiliicoccales archaeon]|jgi:PAS domain S-box-containing protein
MIGVHHPRSDDRMIGLLFVDDDSGLREIAQFYFESNHRFSIDLASSVDEALVKMSRKEYDAIISDFSMPKRNGLDLLKEVRRARPGLPFIMYSATRDMTIVKNALNGGADMFFEKDSNIMENLERIEPSLELLVKMNREKDQAEQERTQIRHLVDGLSEMILVTDMDLRIVRMNRKAIEVSSCRVSELAGRSFADFVRAEDLDRVVGALWSTLNNHNPRPIRFRLDIDPNVAHHVEMRVTPINRSKHEAGIILSIRDMADAERIEAAERRNRGLEQMLDLMRHDVIDHMDQAEGYLRALEGTILEPHKRRYLEEISRTMGALREHIDLNNLYQDLGEKGPLWQDLGDIFDRAVDGLDLRNVELNHDLGRIEVLADPHADKALNTILSNLVRERNGARKVSISHQVSRGGLTIMIDDDGMGIRQDEKFAVFEYGHFFGNWRGLHLAKEILMLTDVSVREIGIQNLGSRFEIVVPDGNYRYCGCEENVKFSAGPRIKATN